MTLVLTEAEVLSNFLSGTTSREDLKKYMPFIYQSKNLPLSVLDRVLEQQLASSFGLMEILNQPYMASVPLPLLGKTLRTYFQRPKHHQTLAETRMGIPRNVINRYWELLGVEYKVIPTSVLLNYSREHFKKEPFPSVAQVC